MDPDKQKCETKYKYKYKYSTEECHNCRKVEEENAELRKRLVTPIKKLSNTSIQMFHGIQKIKSTKKIKKIEFSEM